MGTTAQRAIAQRTHAQRTHSLTAPASCASPSVGSMTGIVLLDWCERRPDASGPVLRAHSAGLCAR